MSKRRKVSDKLPAITSDIPRDLRLYLDRVRETLGGYGNDQLVTIGDLQRLGVGRPTTPTPTPPPDDFLPTPPVIADLSAQGAFQNIILGWTHVPYRGHMYVEVWGSDIFDIDDTEADHLALGDLENATLIGFAPSAVFTDRIGGSRGRYYWVRNANLEGNTGPFNAVAGTRAETARDVDFLITTLQGQISEGVLAESLASRIDLIDIRALTGYDIAINARSAADDARIIADTAWDAVDNAWNFIDSINAEFEQYRTETGAWINQYQQVTNSLVQTAESLMVRTDSNESQILNIMSVTAEQAQTIQLIGVRTDATESNILNLQTVTTEQAQTIQLLGVRTDAAESNILNQQTVTAEQAQTIQLLGVRTDETESSISNLQTVTTEQAQTIQLLGVRTDAAESSVLNLQTVTAEQAQTIVQLGNKTGNLESEILRVDQVSAGAAASVLLLTARTETAESEILDTKSVLADQAQSITGLVTRVEGTESAVFSINQTTANMASQLNQVQLEQGDQSAAIQQESQVRANETGQLFAQYTVKLDVNGYVAGFGLSSTPAEAGGQTSEFAVLADRFYIASPSLGAESAPFIVQATPTTINGVAVPAGIYMVDAFIRNGSIVNAKIANAAIDDAKIANLSAGKITTGTLAAERIDTYFLSAKQFVGVADNGVEVRIGYSSGANEVFGIYAPNGTPMLAYNTTALELQLNNSRLGDASIKHIGAFSKEVWDQIAPTDGTGGTEILRDLPLNTGLNSTRNHTISIPEANPSPALVAITIRDALSTVGHSSPNQYTAPTYRVVVRRGSTSGTIVSNTTKTGEAYSRMDDTIPVTYHCGFHFNETFEITDSSHGTSDGSPLVYVVQVTRISGSVNSPLATSLSLSVPILGGGGARALGQLNDVEIATPANNQFLTYNSSLGRWTNSGPPSTVVPATRTVNGKALSSNITLTAADLDAISASDNTVVRTTGNQTIAGTKTFTDSTHYNGDTAHARFNTNYRIYGGGYSTSIAAGEIVELATLSILGNSRNITVKGRINGNGGSVVGTVDFNINVRSNTLPSKNIQILQEKTSYGREVELIVYEDTVSTDGLIHICARPVDGSLQSINMAFEVFTRSNYSNELLTVINSKSIFTPSGSKLLVEIGDCGYESNAVYTSPLRVHSKGTNRARLELITQHASHPNEFIFGTGGNIDWALSSRPGKEFGLWNFNTNSWGVVFNHTTNNAIIGGTVSAVDHIATSDLRTKSDLQQIPSALDKVSQLTGYTFARKITPNRREAGYIAQDLEAVLPEGVFESEDGTKQVSNSAVIGLLIEAVKELSAEVERLKRGDK